MSAGQREYGQLPGSENARREKMSIHPRYLDKYELCELLGQGGIAKVWKAYDTQLQRYVAIKQLRTSMQNDPDFLQRFIHEAQLIAALHHPNIVQVYDFQITTAVETGEPLAYMVMEYIEDGQTLADYLRRTSCQGCYPTYPTDKHLLQIFAAIGRAVDYAHMQGMIHRDIKPANILLDQRNTTHLPDGEPILSDFGIARLMGASNKTVTHGWIGTPLYLSPEQAQGQTGTQSSDIYSLGVILYEICTGVRPFRGENIPAIIFQHVSSTPTPPCQINPHISPALSDIIMRCLVKNPTQRFSSASDLTAALAEALNLPAPEDLDQTTILSPSSRENPLPPLKGNPPTPSLPNKKRWPLFAILLAAMLTFGLLSGILYWPTHSNAISGNQAIGHFTFASSGMASESSDDGENDRVIIDIHNLPPPDNNHVYYAWLLSDEDADENTESTLPLGPLNSNQGNVHLVYNDPNHKNLLNTYSQLLITQEKNSATTPAEPALDPNDKHYKAEIFQTNNCEHRPHCQLENLRRLLTTDPDLGPPRLKTQIFGGLDIGLFRNTERVLTESNSAQNDWEQKNADNFRNQLIQILDYLDGDQNVSHDLPGTLGNLNTSPNNAPIGLIAGVPGIAPYLPRVKHHIDDLTENPGVTPAQRQLARQISTDLDNAQGCLQKVHDDAEQLLKTPAGNLFSPTSQGTLKDMVTNARYAYAGQFDPNVSQFEGGVVQSYYGGQELASFDIIPTN